MEVIPPEHTQTVPPGPGQYDSSFATPVRRAQRVVFGELDTVDGDRPWQPGAHAIEYEPGEVLTAWNELAVSELGHVDVDVAMVETDPHLVRENTVKLGEVEDETSQRIDLSAERDVANIAVAVKILTRTEPEHFLIFLFAPLRSSIPMGGGERDRSSEVSSRHRNNLQLETG